jgi:hypothetical protein
MEEKGREKKEEYLFFFFFESLCFFWLENKRKIEQFPAKKV